MLFTPFNFSFSLQRVAVFEWEPVQPADEAAGAPTPVACEDAVSQPYQRPLDATSPPAMQLVFKGYEWASVANCGLFPRPSFEDCFVGGPEHANEQTDSTEGERRARQNEAARRSKPAAVGPDLANPVDGLCSTPAPCDPLKPRQP